jgi:hypothetical protein
MHAVLTQEIEGGEKRISAEHDGNGGTHTRRIKPSCFLGDATPKAHEALSI